MIAMTIDEVRAMLAEVQRRASTGDDEATHGAEVDLYIAVLTAIADGTSDAPTLARIALRARDIEFPRYFA